MWHLKTKSSTPPRQHGLDILNAFQNQNVLAASTIDTEIKVKFIPRKYFFAFALVLILIGQMIFCIDDYIDTSPQILLSLSLS